MKFFADRLANRVPMRTIFWRDMIAVGTMLNLAFVAFALALAAFDWPIWSVFLVFLAPLPYNAFMWHCVWKAAEDLNSLSCLTIRLAATGWLMVAIVV